MANLGNKTQILGLAFLSCCEYRIQQTKLIDKKLD